MAKSMPKEPSLQKILKPFLPLFVVAAALPFLLFGVISQNTYSLFSRADSANTLRVWLEPTTVLTKAGKPVTVTVMASLDKKESLLPGLSLNFLKSSEGVLLDTDTLSYSKPFGGQVVLGYLTITPQQPGKETVTIPMGSVQSITEIPLEIMTEGVTVVTQ